MTSASLLPNPLGGYENWAAFARNSGRFESSDPFVQGLGDVLGLAQPPGDAPLPRVDAEWEHDGIHGKELSWNVGFGPRTTAYLLRPAGVTRPLPGVLALHCHGGYKWLGAEQLVDRGSASSAEALGLRDEWYGGRAPASVLAGRGFAVLAHDAFGWGSRRFPLERYTPRLAGAMAGVDALWRERGIKPTAAERYNAAASFHEDTVAKSAGILGTTLAGTVIFDDLVALSVLAALPGVDANLLGSFGFSGGGGRSLLLAALDPRIRSYVVTCMMATFESLTPLYIDSHSWLLNSPGLWRYSEWPDLTATLRARPFLVQYALEDALFPIDGMRAAHQRLTELHRGTGSYRGSFSQGPHAFDVAMQDEAFGFLDGTLGFRRPRD